MAPEAKLYEKFIFLEADMEQARENAKNIPGDPLLAGASKLPIVALKEKIRGGRMAVRMDWDDWLILYHLAVKGARCSE